MKPSSKASRLIREFQYAAEQSYVIGSKAPEDWAEVKRKMQNAKKKLREFIAELESKI